MPGRQLLLLTLLALSATAALSNSSITAGCSGSADLDSLGGLEKLGLVLQPGFEGAGEKWGGLGTLWDGVKDVNGAEEDVYSAVIAIGASYTDNAHPRLPEHAGSLRDTFPYNLYGGRYANGKIAVERLAEELMARPREALDRRGEQGEDEEDLRLVGYAYGGSVVLNGLGGARSNWPDAEEQIATYLADVEAKRIDVGNQRVLHYFNTGINPVSQIWNLTLHAGFNDGAIALARQAVNATAAALEAAILSITTDSALTSPSSDLDFLVVGIPPLDLLPALPPRVPSSFSPSQRLSALALLQSLTTQYNYALNDFSSSLCDTIEKRGGRAWFYDLAGLWKRIYDDPEAYGVARERLGEPCFDASRSEETVCEEPERYVYWDGVHPVTSIHAIMAKEMSALIRHAQSDV